VLTYRHQLGACFEALEEGVLMAPSDSRYQRSTVQAKKPHIFFLTFYH